MLYEREQYKNNQWNYKNKEKVRGGIENELILQESTINVK